MIRLRRPDAVLALLAVPVLLAGCASGDVLDGTGSVVAAPRSGDFPSGPSGSSSTQGPTDTSGPTGAGPVPSVTPTGGTTSLTALTGYATTLRLDPAFVTALTALKVTPGLVGTAKLSGSSLALPVTGGAIKVLGTSASQLASGSFDHAGSGLTLTAGTTKVSVTDLRFEFATTSQVTGAVAVNGKTAARAVPLFDLDTTSARVFGSTRVVTLGGIEVKFSVELAALLNKVFATSGFAPGLVVGSAISTLIGRN